MQLSSPAFDVFFSNLPICDALQLHLDERTGDYYDFGNHTQKVELAYVDRKDPKTGLVYAKDLIRITSGKPKLRFVPHYGYNSLFPLLMRLIPPVSTRSF